MNEAPVRKGDLVMVTTGREKGKSGKVVEILQKVNRVRVEKLQLVKRHAKPSQQHRHGGIIEKEASIHWSNVALVCTKCGKSRRHRFKVDKAGEKLRVCARCGEELKSS